MFYLASRYFFIARYIKINGAFFIFQLKIQNLKKILPDYVSYICVYIEGDLSVSKQMNVFSKIT